ncbi:MAG: BlaI/MecI/CopY family transcriptional regulator [Pseudomonadota bacterium]|nr:BlaI/MecI/CopY family transcriptional regulator [Pseudomonadota bacterium]
MKKSRHAQSTLPNTLGELELCVMAEIWQAPGIDAKTVAELISRQHPSTLSTIQSTLERLVRKGLLEREKFGHAFNYTALVSRAELLGLLMKDVIGLLHDGSPNTILSSFVNVASNIDESALDHLEHLIQRKRAQLEQRRADTMDAQEYQEHDDER